MGYDIVFARKKGQNPDGGSEILAVDNYIAIGIVEQKGRITDTCVFILDEDTYRRDEVHPKVLALLL